MLTHVKFCLSAFTVCSVNKTNFVCFILWNVLFLLWNAAKCFCWPDSARNRWMSARCPDHPAGLKRGTRAKGNRKERVEEDGSGKEQGKNGRGGKGWMVCEILQTLLISSNLEFIYVLWWLVRDSLLQLSRVFGDALTYMEISWVLL